MYKNYFYKDNFKSSTKGGDTMALELVDIITRYNAAKANEDDMIKDIELQKIQAEFLDNNERLASADKIISEKEDEIAKLKLDNERLRDSNAELRIKQGAYVEDKTEEVVEETVEEPKIRTFDEIAEDF